MVVMAAVAAATAARLIRVDREAAGHRQAATGPQGARQRAVAEGDDAALQLPDPAAVEPALAKREPNPHAEIIEEPRHVLSGHRIGTDRLNVVEQGKCFLNLGLHVELLRADGQAGCDFRERLLPFGEFNAKVPQGRVQHGPHVIVLGLEDSPRGLLNLSAELFHLPVNLGVHGFLRRLWLAARRPGPSLDRGTKLFSPAGPLHGGHDRPQRELEEALGIHRVVVAVLPLRLHVCTAAVDRSTSAAIPADGAVHNGAAAFRKVEDPNREGIGTGIGRLSLAGLRAGSLLQLLLQPLPADAVEVGKLTGTGLDPDRAVVL
ncbi:MAG: hypothetical protein DWI03_01915 [Planctomycetota bacterium]|nr:MAG: hypothetical protein DWI03_01915 [Planctomycetota bacterium]